MSAVNDAELVSEHWSRWKRWGTSHFLKMKLFNLGFQNGGHGCCGCLFSGVEYCLLLSNCCCCVYDQDSVSGSEEVGAVTVVCSRGPKHPGSTSRHRLLTQVPTARGTRGCCCAPRVTWPCTGRHAAARVSCAWSQLVLCWFEDTVLLCVACTWSTWHSACGQESSACFCIWPWACFPVSLCPSSPITVAMPIAAFLWAPWLRSGKLYIEIWNIIVAKH